MAWFPNRKDPLEEFYKEEKEIEIPKVAIDIPRLLAEKQARKIFGRFIRLDSKNEKLLVYFNKFIKENRLQEQVIRIAEEVALRGQVIVTLERWKERETPVLIMAYPLMLGKVEKLLLEEKSAVVWKYLVIDDKTHPVKDVITPTTVKRMIYNNINTIDAGDGVGSSWKSSMILTLERLEKSNII